MQWLERCILGNVRMTLMQRSASKRIQPYRLTFGAKDRRVLVRPSLENVKFLVLIKSATTSLLIKFLEFPEVAKAETASFIFDFPKS